jgi:putative lipoprotein
MRIVEGEILLPANTLITQALHVVIEVRDVSLADIPSTLVAQQRLDNVALRPQGRIRFNISVPEVEPNRSLSIQVHIDIDGTGLIKAGDLLTTTNISIPNRGTLPLIEVPVVVI